VDFSGASGAEAMLVMTGPGAPDDQTATAGGTTFSFRFLGRESPPALKSEGNKVVVGRQTVSQKDRVIVLGTMAEPWRDPVRA
jgi:hypothetical protein